jgi:hypothetical protein
MVANQGFGALDFRVTDQRADSGPSSKHITSFDINIWGQVAANFRENPVDVLLRRFGLSRDLRRLICRTGYSVALPRKKEVDGSMRPIFEGL